MKTFTITNVDGTLHDEFEVIVGLDRTFEITLAEDGSNDPTKVVQLFDDAPTHAVPTARRVRELERDVRWLKKRVTQLEVANDQLYHAVETLGKESESGNDRDKEAKQ